MSNRKPLVGFDPGPVVAAAGSQVELGRRMNVPTKTVARWCAKAVIPWMQADRAAVAVGLHPCDLWPEWWDVVEQLDDDRPNSRYRSST